MMIAEPATALGVITIAPSAGVPEISTEHSPHVCTQPYCVGRDDVGGDTHDRSGRGRDRELNHAVVLIRQQADAAGRGKRHLNRIHEVQRERRGRVIARWLSITYE
jgi:hypothetical protein